MSRKEESELKHSYYYNRFKFFVPSLKESFNRAKPKEKREIKNYIYGIVQMTMKEKDIIWDLIVK